ncbi:Zinc finger, RING/FYVE/PHD-type [Trema orientale]|uniref:Zinc finger, RING/FYVE/PHD-type n=1 Tax=Trema orientale TaxID=63057 RepID=A0A2P5G183_TREOI|nr:Zinc finger, RING/FYVE/PHD-type [Trema orientale]
MALKRYSDRGLQLNISDMNEVQLITNWEDVICPICLDFPHNGVLLQCSSYEKGCRPFVCDTNHLHSNCLDRLKSAYGMSPSSTSDAINEVSPEPTESEENKPSCPLCRGEVTGWVIVDDVRAHLDEKKRCCDEEQCKFMGTYSELQKHAQKEHPHARPSKIDPARQLDWENFQQSSEIIDVLSTIHSEVPRGVVLGDYVIEYGEEETGDEFEDFPGDKGNWWTSCILYQVFDNFRNSRNRRRSRVSDARRGSRRSSYDTSNSDEGSVTSVEFADYRVDETDDEFVSTGAPSRSGSSHRRS